MIKILDVFFFSENMNSTQTAAAERAKSEIESKNSVEEKNYPDQLFFPHTNDRTTACVGNENFLMMEISEPTQIEVKKNGPRNQLLLEPPIDTNSKTGLESGKTYGRLLVDTGENRTTQVRFHIYYILDLRFFP